MARVSGEYPLFFLSFPSHLSEQVNAKIHWPYWVAHHRKILALPSDLLQRMPGKKKKGWGCSVGWGKKTAGLSAHDTQSGHTSKGKKAGTCHDRRRRAHFVLKISSRENVCDTHPNLQSSLSEKLTEENERTTRWTTPRSRLRCCGVFPPIFF